MKSIVETSEPALACQLHARPHWRCVAVPGHQPARPRKTKHIMPKRRTKKSVRPVTRDKKTDVRLSVTAQLNHKLMLLDRCERYEDPLQDELEKHGFGKTSDVNLVIKEFNKRLKG